MAAIRDLSALPRIEQAYRVLGLTPDSSGLRIKREYRRLAKIWHPDKCPHNTAEQRRATERMREINDAYQLIKHAPLRYRADASRVGRPSVTPPVPRTTLVSDKVEYAVRFVCGFAFGLFVSVAALISDVPVAIAAAVPLAAGLAAVVYGDRFWYWMLKHWWIWMP